MGGNETAEVSKNSKNLRKKNSDWPPAKTQGRVARTRSIWLLTELDSAQEQNLVGVVRDQPWADGLMQRSSFGWEWRHGPVDSGWDFGEKDTVA